MPSSTTGRCSRAGRRSKAAGGLLLALAVLRRRRRRGAVHAAARPHALHVAARGLCTPLARRRRANRACAWAHPLRQPSRPGLPRRRQEGGLLPRFSYRIAGTAALARAPVRGRTLVAPPRRRRRAARSRGRRRVARGTRAEAAGRGARELAGHWVRMSPSVAAIVRATPLTVTVTANGLAFTTTV